MLLSLNSCWQEWNYCVHTHFRTSQSRLFLIPKVLLFSVFVIFKIKLTFFFFRFLCSTVFCFFPADVILRVCDYEAFHSLLRWFVKETAWEEVCTLKDIYQIEFRWFYYHNEVKQLRNGSIIKKGHHSSELMVSCTFHDYLIFIDSCWIILDVVLFLLVWC